METVVVHPSFKKTFELLKKQDKDYAPVSGVLILAGLSGIGYYIAQAVKYGFAASTGSTLIIPAVSLGAILLYPLGMLADKRANTYKEITQLEYDTRKANGTLDDIFTHVI